MDCSPPAPLSIGFSRQEYWSGLPFTSSGDLPNPGTKSTSPALAGRFFTTEPPGKNPSPWGQELAISISLLKRGRGRTGGKKSPLALHRFGNCQDPSPPLPLVCLWVRWGGLGEGCGHVQALGLQLQGHSQPPAPDLAIRSVSMCCGRGPWVLLRFGFGLLGGHVSSRWGHRSCTQKRGSLFPRSLTRVCTRSRLGPGRLHPPPNCLISLWQLKQDSGLEKGEGGDHQVGPGLACGLQESHL